MQERETIVDGTKEAAVRGGNGPVEPCGRHCDRLLRLCEDLCRQGDQALLPTPASGVVLQGNGAPEVVEEDGIHHPVEVFNPFPRSLVLWVELVGTSLE